MTDLNCQSPQFFNIRNTAAGLQTKKGFKTGGLNLHGIMEFERKAPQKKTLKSDQEYLKDSLGDVLVQALAAAARERPDDPVTFVSDFLK